MRVRACVCGFSYLLNIFSVLFVHSSVDETRKNISRTTTRWMKIKIQNHLELKFSIFYWTHSRSQQPRSDTIYYCSSTIRLPLYYVSTTTVITIIIILLYGRYDSPIFHQNSFLVHCLLLVTGVDCVNIAWFTRTHTENERKRERERARKTKRKEKRTR